MASLEEKVALLKTQAEQKKEQEEQEKNARLLTLEEQRIAAEKAAQLELENQQKEKAAQEEQERKEQEKTKNLETLALLETQMVDMEQTLHVLTIKGAEYNILTYLQSNKELFKPLGITDLKSFVGHPEFQDVEEVDRYQQLLATTPELSLDTEMVLQKMSSKGYGQYAELNEDTISLAKKTIENLKPFVEKQILKIKLEIPEKRQEVIETEASHLENTLPHIELSSLEKLEFGTRNNPDSYIEQKGEDIKFVRWWEADLVPKEFGALKDVYGAEVAQEILAAAHKQKVHKAIESYDAKRENYIGFEKVLAENSYEALLDAKQSYRRFEERVHEARNALKQKSQALKEKGIDFDEKYIPGYGGTFEEVVLSFYDEPIDSSRRNPLSALYEKNKDHPFPPTYPYKKVQDIIEQRTSDIDEFIAVVSSLETKADIENFVSSVQNKEPKQGTVQYFHKKMFAGKIDENIKPPFQGFFSITEKVHSLSEAERLVNKQKDLYSKKEEVFTSTIEKATEAKILLAELKKEVQTITGSDTSPTEWKGVLERTTQVAEKAQRELGSLDIFQNYFQGQEYRLDRGFVTDVAIETQIKEKREELDATEIGEDNLPKGLKKQKELIDDKIKNYPKEPRWFGKKEHKEGLEKLNTESFNLGIKIREKESEINKLAEKKSLFVLPESPFKEAYRNFSTPKGSIIEVLAPVRVFLEEKAKKVVPLELIQKVEKYHKLVKELQ